MPHPDQPTDSPGDQPGGRRPLPLGLTGRQLGVVGLALAGMIQVATESGRPEPQGAQPLILALAGTVPLALLARQPLAALVTIVAAYLFAYSDAGHPTVAVVIAATVAAWSAGRHRSPWRTTIAVAPVLIAPWLATANDRRLAWVAAALVIGGAVAGTRWRTRRASARRDASVRAMQGALLDHVARGERARIARELHDVVAHHVSLIAVRAEAAQFVADRPGAANAAEFAGIAGNARTALAEMRRLLGVLRTDADAEPDEREPQPGLDRLAQLIAAARLAQGGAVRIILRGTVRPLAAGVELTAFRIVQEALTNTRRHAPGAAVDVDLTYGPDALEIRVRDTGPGPDADRPGGHGLTGMRERAAMLGGQLSAGPAPAGGYLITARLPT